MWPEPDDTKLPDNTSSPTALSTASASPVRRDSSTVRPWAATTSPSTTTWLPGESSRRSSATTSDTRTSVVVPSRTTRAFGAESTARAASVRRARSSWTTPITLFERMTPAKRASLGCPATRISTSSVPMMAFTGVITLARRICLVVRTGASGTSLTCPSAIRWATSAAVRPKRMSGLTREMVGPCDSTAGALEGVAAVAHGEPVAGAVL